MKWDDILDFVSSFIIVLFIIYSIYVIILSIFNVPITPNNPIVENCKAVKVG